MVFTVRWGVVSTGNMAHTFTKDILQAPTEEIKHVLSAVSSTSTDRGKAFLREFSSTNGRAYGSVDELALDPDVDAIYVASPTSMHYPHALTCLMARKAVLVEKAFTINAKQARHLIQVSRENNVYLAEALWTRYLPITQAIKHVVHTDRVLGKLIRVSSDLAITYGAKDLTHNLRNASQGGGALLAVGVYPLTWAMIVLFEHEDNAREMPQIATSMILTDVDAATAAGSVATDETTTVLLTFPRLKATAIAKSTLLASTLPGPSVVIQGEHGNIIIPVSAHRPTSFSLELYKTTTEPARLESQEFEIPGRGLFYQADALARGIRDGRIEPDECRHEDTIAMMEILDGVRKLGNFAYPGYLEDLIPSSLCS